MRAFVCAPLIACLAACAASPSNGGATRAAVQGDDAADARQPECTEQARDAAELVELNVKSALPLLRDLGDDDMFASDVSVDIGASRLRYEASYSLEHGDVLSILQSDAANPSPPKHLGGQHFGQNVRLALPELAGSPLSLGFTSEFDSTWMVAGYSESKRRRATLNWSPGSATVDVHWNGTGVPLDATAALTCNLRSTVRVPTHESGGRSEGLVLSGGDCTVAGGDSPFTGLRTETWGLGYEWHRPGRKSEAVLRVIEPVREQPDEYGYFEPGYELSLSHRRDLGLLSAKAVVLLRQASIWEDRAPVGADGASWATSTALTLNLPHAALSANWAKGVDRLWFTPDVGHRHDIFGLALNLSQWIASYLPDSSPKLAMNWNWSREYLPGEDVDGNSSISLDVAMIF